jgi:hypothetical protein
VALEVGDQLGHRLLGDLRPFGEHADPGAAVIEEREDVAVGRADLRMAALGEALVQFLGRDAERLAKEDAEVLGPLAGRGVGEAA